KPKLAGAVGMKPKKLRHHGLDVHAEIISKVVNAVHSACHALLIFRRGPVATCGCSLPACRGTFIGFAAASPSGILGLPHIALASLGAAGRCARSRVGWRDIRRQCDGTLSGCGET